MLGLGIMVAGVPLGLGFSEAARRQDRHRTLGTIGLVLSYLAGLMIVGLVLRSLFGV